MSSYTVSKLAQDAGVSVSVVRDYVLRGLLKPAGHTEGGYGLYDAHALERLRLVRALFEAAAVLASTTAGAFIGDHWGVAAVVLAALFFLFLARAIRAFRSSP